MFGLKWKMSPNDIELLGVELEPVHSDMNFYAYITKSLPKNFSITKNYMLIFDGDSSLVKIYMYSKTIEDNFYGTEGKKVFSKFLENLKTIAVLDDKSTFMKTGMILYENNNEFYKCLSYKGCGYWYAILRNKNKDICLSLEAFDRTNGYLKLIIESIPYFDDAVKRKEQLANKKDIDALK